MKIDEADFTVFDVETTGLFPYYGDRICEIAYSRTRGKTISAIREQGKLNVVNA